MLELIYGNRKIILLLYVAIAIIGVALSSRVYFKYDFEQFFPTGDEDLEQYYEFMEKFEGDDDFILIGFRRDKGIYNPSFLQKIDSLTDICKSLPNIKQAYSITKHKHLLKTPFAFVMLDAVHPEDAAKLSSDSIRISTDEGIIGNIVSADGKTTAITLKTDDSLTQKQCEELIDSLNAVLEKSSLKNYHILGKANFQTQFVRLQIKEFILSTIFSALLVTIILTLIFRNFRLVLICLSSVLMCLIVFLGFLGALRIPLDIMSALYPILMIIVGISDVVHFSTKYIAELRNGLSRREAVGKTVNEIGLATLLTSLTTAIGFATLYTSLIEPVRRFGLVSGIGVMLAYLVVLTFTTALLSGFDLEKIDKRKSFKDTWTLILLFFYDLGLRKRNLLVLLVILVMAVSGYGISKITTDVHILHSLPRGEKITEDFKFFEDELSGFRPFEIAAMSRNGYSMDDHEVILEINKLEVYLSRFPEKINGIQSVTTVYKSMNRAYHGDKQEFYFIPEDKEVFEKYKKRLKSINTDMFDIVLSKDRKDGRISASMADIGSDSIFAFMEKVDRYIQGNIDTGLVNFIQTGTGVVVDKNQEYVRKSLISGLAIAFLAVSLLMALLFRKLKMLIISLIPNIIPLCIGGAILGFSRIELNAPTSIIFAISFGIAVDDTIHFLSKFKHEINKGCDVEQAIKRTFLETGKAILVTSLILFFGFLILLVSRNPPTFNIGLLISATLLSAVLADLTVLPILLRYWFKKG